VSWHSSKSIIFAGLGAEEGCLGQQSVVVSGNRDDLHPIRCIAIAAVGSVVGCMIAQVR
jgi:hypothetical protein